MKFTYFICRSVSMPCFGSILIFRSDFSIYFTSFSVCDILHQIIIINHSQAMIKSKIKSPFFSTKSQHNTIPLASLKKFCQSLPCSEAKPSGLNLIVWKKRNYQPNDKEKRLKVQNDIVKQHIAHESQALKRTRKTHGRTHSLTEPTSNNNINYRQQYLKISRKEVSTSLISKEEEEVFGHLRTEDSVKEQFQRNHKEVWRFIVSSKKKSTEETTQTTNISMKSNRNKNEQIQAKRLQKQKFKHQLNDYLRKWKPSNRSTVSKSAGQSNTTAKDSPLCSKFTTIALARSEIVKRIQIS